VNPVGRLALTFLLVICDIAAFSAPARAQQPVPPGQGQTIPPFQQSPVEPPFSPLSGPYTPPPTEALPGQPPPPPPFMKKGGRAALPAAQEERFVLTPSILIDEAYTDNVFLDNDFMRSGFITSFTPGLLLGFRMPDFGVGVGYVFTSEIYAKETELNDALARWGASVAAFYDLTPRLRLNFRGRLLRGQQHDGIRHRRDLDRPDKQSRGGGQPRVDVAVRPAHQDPAQRGLPVGPPSEAPDAAR
jgi:hypothetical protein